VSWQVELLDERVQRELYTLPPNLRARFDHIVKLIETMGLPDVGAPYVKHLEGKLWEMRMKGKDGIARAIYVTAKNERVVVVHVFGKKTQKTPTNALETARKRAREVKL
jgi:phage-related protein